MAQFTKQSGKYIYTPTTVVDTDLGVEVGDVTQASFFPQVKLKRWGNAANCSFRIQIPGGQKETVTEQGEQIVWSKGDYQAIWYDRPDASGEGGFEFEIILGKRPPTNSLTFSIVHNDCVFDYQDSAANRPVNVVGSYAVYSATKRHNQYKCGKICHIYRPHAVDSAGHEVWGTVVIDPVAGTMTLSIPQDFLNTATYPVTVDPTFGYTSIGATTSVDAGLSYATRAVNVTASAGTLTALKVWVSSVNGGGNTQMALYADSSNNPGSRITSVGSVSAQAGAWNTATFSTAITSGQKWIATSTDTGGVTIFLAYDSGSPNLCSLWAGTLNDPFGTPDANFSFGNVSMHAVYDPPAVSRRRLTLLGVA